MICDQAQWGEAVLLLSVWCHSFVAHLVFFFGVTDFGIFSLLLIFCSFTMMNLGVYI